MSEGFRSRLHRGQHRPRLDQPPALPGAGAAGPPELRLHEIAIRELPFYSVDHDADFPAPARACKRALADADAVLIVTPDATTARSPAY